MRKSFIHIYILLIIFSLMNIQGYAAIDENTISFKSEILKILSSELQSLKDLYIDLHKTPELSSREINTSRKMEKELKNAGFEVTYGVGKYGVVGIIKNGPGKTVMVRADMDALPIIEKTGLSYKSKVSTKDSSGNDVGVMHACGHDIHMTVFTGTARVLAKLKDKWSGTLMMVAQPAEETGIGAKAMLEDGLFTRFPRPDYALALHDGPIPAGMVASKPGYILANVDSVDIEVKGIGGHGAAPETTKDPIVIASQIVLALQTIVSREVPPNKKAVVTVGSIHGGTKHNIIPDRVHLKLTVRSYEKEIRKSILDSIKRIAKGIGIAAGLKEKNLPVVTIMNESISATYNDPELTKRVMKSFRKVLGENNVLITEAVTAGEDFSEYGRVEPKIPTFIYWLGAVNPEKFMEAQRSGEKLPGLHSPFWAPDYEPTIKTGVLTMSSAVLDLLKK
ncbi:MAG: amidohydrolase [Candidatus Aminicenantes bacterium]|nr:amidohydrolase [Candidatus Aminicenantes bacterium]